MDNSPTIMGKLFTLFTVLFTGLMLTGCSLMKKELPPLPEPATNNALTNAEKELDKATAERLSKAAAAIGMANVLVDKEPASKNQEVLKSEIKLAKTLVGKAEIVDWEAAQKRASAALGGQPIADAYGKEQAEAVSLRVKLKEADAKYEEEKAKKQAEFNAKLLEREQALAQEKALRAQESEEARKDKFLYLGGLVCLAGLACFIFGPKVVGAQVFLGGIVLSSIPTIWGSPYFPYIVGAIALVVVVAVLFSVFRKPVEETPKSEE